MNIIASIFGDPVPTAVKLVFLTIALVAILLLIFWIFRKFVGSPTIKAARGRLPRLAVTDAANLDDRRRLVLVRRDDVEHLVMIGGATDVLIEANIVRLKPVQTQTIQAPHEAAQPGQIVDKQQEPELPHSPPQPITATAASITTAGAMAAAAVSTSGDPSGEPEAELEVAPEEITAAPVTDEEPSIETIAEPSMEEIAAQVDETFPDAPSTEQIIEQLVEQSTEPATEPVTEPSKELPSFEIEPDALSSLEDALGMELAETSDRPVEEVAVPPLSTNGVGSPDVDMPSAQTGEAQPASKVEETIPTENKDKKPDMEDEMQKLLDELAGEKV